MTRRRPTAVVAWRPSSRAALRARWSAERPPRGLRDESREVGRLPQREESEQRGASPDPALPHLRYDQAAAAADGSSPSLAVAAAGRRRVKVRGATPVGVELAREAGEVGVGVVVDDGIRDERRAVPGGAPSPQQVAVLGGAERLVEAAERAQRLGGVGAVVGSEEARLAAAVALVASDQVEHDLRRVGVRVRGPAVDGATSGGDRRRRRDAREEGLEPAGARPTVVVGEDDHAAARDLEATIARVAPARRAERGGNAARAVRRGRASLGARSMRVVVRDDHGLDVARETRHQRLEAGPQRAGAVERRDDDRGSQHSAQRQLGRVLRAQEAVERARHRPPQVEVDEIRKRVRDLEALRSGPARARAWRADRSDDTAPRRTARRRSGGGSRSSPARVAATVGLQPISAASSSQNGVKSTRCASWPDSARNMWSRNARQRAIDALHRVRGRQLELPAQEEREPARLELRERRDGSEGWPQEADERERGPDFRVERVQVPRRRGDGRIEERHPRLEAGAEKHDVGVEARRRRRRSPSGRRTARSRALAGTGPTTIARTKSSVLVPNCSLTVPPDSCEQPHASGRGSRGSS